MADPRAVITFDFDNNLTEKNLFVGQIKNSSTPFSAQDWSSKESLSQTTWEEKLKEKIGKCHLTIVLVGKSMSSATGVVKEISFATDLDVPFFGVYVDGAGTSSTLPKGLARNRTIEWDWEGIADAIVQMLTEAKKQRVVLADMRNIGCGIHDGEHTSHTSCSVDARGYSTDVLHTSSDR